MTQLYKWPCPCCKTTAAAYLTDHEAMDVRCPKCGALMRWKRETRQWFDIKIRI